VECKNTNTKYIEDSEKWDHSDIVDENIKWCRHSGKQLAVSVKKKNIYI
jgi:hypothetical protein